MGAWYLDYTIKGGNRLRVEKEFNRLREVAAYEHGNSYSGEINMKRKLEFTHKRFKSYNEASEYLSETCDKWGPALVVEYRNSEGQLVWLVGASCSC